MNELSVTWQRVRSVWWLVVWRGIIGGTVLGGIAGFVIGLFGAVIGLNLETIQTLAALVGFFLGLAWLWIVVRMALRKTYRDFRIALVPVTAG